jgi:hypothetical protein
MEYKIFLRTSPNNWNRAFSPRSTPAVVGPEFNPTRRDRSEVPYSMRELCICVSSILRLCYIQVFERKTEIHIPFLGLPQAPGLTLSSFRDTSWQTLQ